MCYIWRAIIHIYFISYWYIIHHSWWHTSHSYNISVLSYLSCSPMYDTYPYIPEYYTYFNYFRFLSVYYWVCFVYAHHIAFLIITYHTWWYTIILTCSDIIPQIWWYTDHPITLLYINQQPWWYTDHTITLLDINHQSWLVYQFYSVHNTFVFYIWLMITNTSPGAYNLTYFYISLQFISVHLTYIWNAKYVNITYRSW